MAGFEVTAALLGMSEVARGPQNRIHKMWYAVLEFMMCLQRNFCSQY